MWWKKTQPKILIVEDNLNNHPLFQEAFKSVGFRISIRQTADGDFLQEVVGFHPDIISMDIMIGKPSTEKGRDGFQAIELLKADDRTKDIPIIVLSSFFEDHKVQQAKSLGAVDYVSLQGQSIKEVPEIFKRYLENPKKFLPSHPEFRI